MSQGALKEPIKQFPYTAKGCTITSLDLSMEKWGFKLREKHQEETKGIK